MDKQQSVSKQITPAQKETLVNFVYARPQMQSKAFTPFFTKQISDALWEEISSILNAMPGGAVKNAQKWNKTWRDIKNNTKNSTSKQKRYSQGTGGGPPLPPQGPDDKSIIEKIIEILSPVAIDGNLEVPDTASLELPSAKEKIILIDTIINQDQSFNSTETEMPAMSGLSTLNMKTPVTDEKPAKKFRYTKTGRLTDSIRNNKSFLTISESGMHSTEKYRQKKIELLEKEYKEKCEYHQQKIEILKEISSSFTSMAEDIKILRESLQ